MASTGYQNYRGVLSVGAQNRKYEDVRMAHVNIKATSFLLKIYKTLENVPWKTVEIHVENVDFSPLRRYRCDEDALVAQFGQKYGLVFSFTGVY